MNPIDPEILRLARTRRGPYLAVLTAPKDKRAGLLAILALDGELARIPQSVSEPMLGRIRLQWWVDVMPGVVGGRPPSHPVAQALAPLGLDLKALRGLAEARNFDLDEGNAAVGEHIAAAMARGGVLADLLLSVLAVRDAPTREAAAKTVAAWVLSETATAARRVASAHDAQALREHARGWLAEARAGVRASGGDALQRRLARPVLALGRLVERNLDDPHDPLGFGAVLGVWWRSVFKSV